MRAVCRARRGGLSAGPEGGTADASRGGQTLSARSIGSSGGGRVEVSRCRGMPELSFDGGQGGPHQSAEDKQQGRPATRWSVQAERAARPAPRGLCHATFKAPRPASTRAPPETPLPRATRRRPRPLRDGRRRGHPPRDLAELGLARHVCSGRCRKPQPRPGQEARCADSAHFRDASVTECAQAVRLSELPSPGRGVVALVQAQSGRASQRPGCVPRVGG